MHKLQKDREKREAIKEKVEKSKKDKENELRKKAKAINKQDLHIRKE